MALTLTMTTELEAVNQMLSIIGERPVNDLETTVLTSAKMAQQKLHYVSRKIQARGFPCNRDVEYVLTPDVDGIIIIAPNIISLDTSDMNKNYVIREGKLYNKTKQTFVFTDTVKVDILWFQAYDTLPEPLKDYIYIVAARELQAQYRTSDTKDKLTVKQEVAALAEVRKWKMRTNDRTVLNNTPINRIVNRLYNPLGMGA